MILSSNITHFSLFAMSIIIHMLIDIVVDIFNKTTILKINVTHPPHYFLKKTAIMQ